MENKKYTSYDKAVEKIRKYCTTQDRCQSEVRKKLRDWNVYSDWIEEIISDLIIEKYLDELRFTRSYVRGKFEMNKWGRRKITDGLKMKNISEYCISSALESEITDEDYYECLFNILQKKYNILKNKSDWSYKIKMAKHAIGKGFESHMVWNLINENFDNKK